MEDKLFLKKYFLEDLCELSLDLQKEAKELRANSSITTSQALSPLESFFQNTLIKEYLGEKNFDNDQVLCRCSGASQETIEKCFEQKKGLFETCFETDSGNQCGKCLKDIATIFYGNWSKSDLSKDSQDFQDSQDFFEKQKVRPRFHSPFSLCIKFKKEFPDLVLRLFYERVFFLGGASKEDCLEVEEFFYTNYREKVFAVSV